MSAILAAALFSIAAMQRIVSLSLPTISPDGTMVAFTASHIDVDHNRSNDSLEIFDRRTNRLRVLAVDHRAVDALAWSPDGSKLAAVLDAAHQDIEDQLYLIDPVTGAERQLTSGKSGVIQIAWSPRGDRIAFSRRNYVAPPTGEAAFRDGFEVGDNAYLVTKPAQPAHVWLVDMNGSEERLTDGPRSVVDSPISWSAGGESIIYAQAPSGVHAMQGRSEIVRLNIATKRSTPATPQHLYEDNSLFSPGGSHIAYRYNRDGDPMNENEAMVDGRDVSRQLDRHVEVLAWMPGNALLLQVYDRAQAPLYVQPVRGAARRLALGPVIDASIQENGSVARDGTIAFIGVQQKRPDELYVLPPGAREPRRLTSLNEGTARLELGRSQRITWRGPGGMLEDGVLTYPPGYRAHRKYPLVLRIHGGPTESSTISFDQFWQLAASHGYLVFAPNYRGSNDLGNAYEHAIFNDASIGPGQDIMAGIKAVERLGIVDSKRIAVSGWSYGGQLTSWMESHYQIWKAAVAGAAVNDLVVDYAIADDIDADAVSFAGGSPYVGSYLVDWRKHSPITYFKNIRTPTLIFCNVYDVRVPIVESYEMYHALRDNGVPVKFYAYPTTGHLPSGPVRLADVYEKWLAWFDRYLR